MENLENYEEIKVKELKENVIYQIDISYNMYADYGYIIKTGNKVIFYDDNEENEVYIISIKDKQNMNIFELYEDIIEP